MVWPITGANLTWAKLDKSMKAVELAVCRKDLLLKYGYNISNDVGRVKELGVVFSMISNTLFTSAHTHWFP